MSKTTGSTHWSQSRNVTYCWKTAPNTFMVSVALSKLGCTELVFIEPGIKVNGAYYRDMLLQKEMLPAIRSIAGELFIFQQDSAPCPQNSVAAWTRDTQIHRSRFCGLQIVQIWTKLTTRSGCDAGTCLQVTDQGRKRVEAEIDRSVVSNAAVCHRQSHYKWRKRLRFCISAKGGHFEHKL